MIHFTDVSADDHFDVNFKILRDPSRPWGKDNYWRISPDCNYSFKDGIFRRRKKQTKEVKKSINFSIGKIKYRPQESSEEHNGTVLILFFRLHPFTTKRFIYPCIIAWFFNWWHSYSPSVTNTPILPSYKYFTFVKYFTIINFDTWYPTYNPISFIWQRSSLLWLISNTAIKWLDSIGDVIIQWTIGWVDIWSRDGKLRSFVWQTLKYVTTNGLLLRTLSKTNWRLTSPVSVIYNPLK